MKQGTTEKIRQAIEARIASGEWLPGSAINEAELAREFGVSRTPVREALIQLMAQGFVLIAPRSGIYVSKLTTLQLLVMLETLAHLEGACAGMVALRISPDALKEISEMHERAAHAIDLEDSVLYAACNKEFHELLYRGCQNEFLVEQISRIRSRTAAYRFTRFSTLAGMRRSWDGHEELMRAVKAGDHLGAREAAIEHIELGGQEFAQAVRNLPGELFADTARSRPSRPSIELVWPAAKRERRA